MSFNPKLIDVAIVEQLISNVQGARGQLPDGPET